MDAVTPLVVPLSDAAVCTEELVGGKAAKLSRLERAGFPVPPGFCITTSAYESYLGDSGTGDAIRMELGRKSLDGMRWEELWDAALRIRSAFMAHPLPGGLRRAIGSALSSLGASGPFAVRSSALGEDSGSLSFAGIHESLTDVSGETDVARAVRLVWASLWSDAALLYRRELKLDPAGSRMAVLVQRMVHADRSGVAFGRDPRDAARNCAIVEAVPGPCRLLVDGMTDPDRWELDRRTGAVIVWTPGRRDERGAGDEAEPLLETDDLNRLLESVLKVEELFRWSPDVEWTGRSSSLTILQARPITTAQPDSNTERSWYLTLSPQDARLRELRARIVEQLIPRLEAEGQRLSEEGLDAYDDGRLAEAIERRSATLDEWKKIYWDEFIPFAHGVRRLATYYNDLVRPDDPYEFVGLLQNQPLLATRRNNAIRSLAARLSGNEALRRVLKSALERVAGSSAWPSVRDELRRAPGGEGFIEEFEDLRERFLDITYDRMRLREDLEPLLRNILELGRGDREEPASPTVSRSPADLEQRLLAAVGDERHEEAREFIEVGRVSWKLRDDDNLLVSRIESQLLRAIELAIRRLSAAGRTVGDAAPDREAAPAVVRALRDPTADPVKLETRRKATGSGAPAVASHETPRQLIGQPASPGLASGRVRIVRTREDVRQFRRGEILVCDAIQPTMTHLVLLAAAIVERRGGMLIHGAIVARELGIPCVNGVHDAAQLLGNGDAVTVDGHLGIVIVGPPELDLELRYPGPG